MHQRLLYAHRGASAEFPENTMPSFERAVSLGVDALELDVHITKDDQILVAHDDTAQRTTGTPYKWTDLTFAEARRLDVGWGFIAPDGTRPYAGKKLSAPAFEEVLLTYPKMRLNVDLKGHRSVIAMLDLLRKLGAEDRVTLASFSRSTLVEVRKRHYAGMTALAQTEIATLLALPAVAWRQLPNTGVAAQVPVKHGPIRFDRPSFIAKCHSLGLRVDYWTVDDPVEAQRLLALGADGIMTNDPAALRSLF